MLIIPSAILAIASDEDRDYMEWLYREHRRLMYATALRYCQNAVEVEDIISDSCVSLIEKIEKLRFLERDELRLYIYAVVRNTAIDHYRKRKRLDSRFFHLSENVVHQVPSDFEVSKQIELREELGLVLQAIEGLSVKERMIMLLKYSVGLSDAEIAEAVGLSPNSVRKYISRAREHIKVRVYKGKGANEVEKR